VTDRHTDQKADDPGVPEALPRTLVLARGRLGAERVDRLWIFPPIRRGRRERGLVAASLFLEGEERRRIVTVTWAAERTGRSLTVEQAFHDEGDAPPDFLPRVMEGVVRRAGQGYGEPREVEIGGDAERYTALVDEFDPSLLLTEQA
jgi:hypothetical protein